MFLVPNKTVKVVDDVGIGLHIMFCMIPVLLAYFLTYTLFLCGFWHCHLYIFVHFTNYTQLSGMGAVNSDLTTKFFCVYYVLMCTVSNHSYVVLN